MAAPARTHIRTERLELVAPDPMLAGLAAQVLDFHRRNDAHLLRWDPPRPDGFLTAELQHGRLVVGAAAFAGGSAFRWWLRETGVAGRVIGNIHFSQISRGAFQNAMLGFSLDAGCEGRGLMHEALSAGIAELFSPGLNLHRIQANVRPDNTRSLNLLRRLGFEHEGLARDYLFIDGAWRDHLTTALRNPGFVGTPSP